MKRIVGFYYRSLFNVCLWAFLSLISLMVLSSSAFALQSGDFTYEESGGTITITGYTGTGGAVVIPAAINEIPVVYIGSSAFYKCSGLTSVTIPDSVTSIGGWAFYSCTGLTSVIIPNSVTSISVAVFEYCTSLTSVTIPSSVTSIGGWAFYSCTGLTSVIIPNSVTSISVAVFEYCTSLTSVTIPSSVTSIGDGAFNGCISLTSVTIPNSITSIGNNTFYNCRKMTSVTIPDSVTSIGSGAFYHCFGLTSVTIPSRVTSIGNYAFTLCNGLTDVTIPNSVTNIGDYAFAWCSGLTSTYFIGNAPSMGQDVFSYGSSNFTVCYNAGSTGFTTPMWYGYPAAVCEVPTAITLSSFIVTPKAGKTILTWSTESETDNAGFNIYRSEAENGQYTKINASLISAKGSSTQGASYEFADSNARNRKTYYYKLEDIDLKGKSTMHGPVKATPRLIYDIGK